MRMADNRDAILEGIYQDSVNVRNATMAELDARLGPAKGKSPAAVTTPVRTSPIRTANDPTDLEGMVNKFLQQSQAVGQREADNAVAAGQKTNELSQIFRDVAQSAARVEYQKGTADLEAQQATRKAALAAGVDPSAASDSIIALMGKIKSNNDTIVQQADQLTKDKSLSLWDDPLAFMKANFFLPDNQRKLQASIDNAKVLDSTVKDLNTNIQSTARTYDLLKESTTKATIEERTKLAAAEGLLKAKNAEIEGIKFDTQSQIALANASHQQIQAMIALKGTNDATERLQMTREQHVLQKEEFDIRRSDRAAELAKKAELGGKTIDEKTLEYINLSRSTLGQPELSKEEFKYQSQIAKKSPEFAYHLENGIRQATLGAQTIGTTPSESLDVIREFPNKLPEIRQETIGLITQAEDALRKTLIYVSAKPAEQAKQLNDQVKQEVALQYANVQKGSIFDVGDLGSYVGNKEGKGIASIASLPISQKLLTPLAMNGQPLVDAKTILDLTVKAVKDGVLTSSEAIDLSKIYQRATQINSVARGIDAFGIPVPKNNTEYNVRIGKLFGETYNLNDPAQVAKYLTKELSRNSLKGLDTTQIPFGQP
jgi:hypothetical protein